MHYKQAIILFVLVIVCSTCTANDPATPATTAKSIESSTVSNAPETSAITGSAAPIINATAMHPPAENGTSSMQSGQISTTKAPAISTAAAQTTAVNKPTAGPSAAGLNGTTTTKPRNSGVCLSTAPFALLSTLLFAVLA